MHSRPHRYDIGQKLLCFEPDSSKAKLIYFAKILKHVSRRDTDIPHYSVHFHGWKCKWDRKVPEGLLLENNEFNRILKRKIDEVAQNVLQKYVDGFPYSGLSINSLLGYCSSSNGIISDRVSRVMNPLFSQTDRNRLICAKVCSSLCILFDFTLRHYLLLPNERLYFLNDFNGQLFEDGRAFCVNFPHEPSNIHSDYRFSSPRYELLPNSEVVKNPQLPCLNYPPYYLLRLLSFV
ncbi:hypothetical protein MN116_003333 [Schistosoma mekongi]|uniref:MSL3 chromodomain-like domain-containing protein n=1 Tax=Schistosoma mekongi TaxID=38744 RepID=A0AAE1ZI80_SCHME|nr:hypothetical protein MN116_003333 [Schistosoma mekongi]